MTNRLVCLAIESRLSIRLVNGIRTCKNYNFNRYRVFAFKQMRRHLFRVKKRY